MKNNAESSNNTDINDEATDSSIRSNSFPVNRRKQNNNYFYNNRTDGPRENKYSHYSNRNINPMEKNKLTSDFSPNADRLNHIDFTNRRKGKFDNNFQDRPTNYKPDFREQRGNSGNYRAHLYNGNSQSSGFFTKPKRNFDSNINSRNFNEREFSEFGSTRGHYYNGRRNGNQLKLDKNFDLVGMNQQFPAKFNNYNKININTEINEMNQRESLIWQLNHNKYECMICVNIIRAESATWSCDNCYNIFHINCISKWARTCGNSVDKDGSKMNLRCPTCQKEYDVNKNVATTADNSASNNNKEWLQYRCFCGKQLNPTVKRGGDIVPHSCDDVCGKPAYKNDKCPHLCSLMCHPGPCPPCEAIVTRNCHCERTKITTKCNADERTLVCGDQCEKYLNCELHRCDNLCHVGQCGTCSVEIEQKCFCDRKSVRMVICGSIEASEETFSCGNHCERMLDCGNHKCESVCHPGDCQPCQWMPDRIYRCWCDKMLIDDIGGGSYHRDSCVDPVPSCGNVCGRKLINCGHDCSQVCHEGPCGPCPLSRDIVCRCGKSVFTATACRNVSESQPMQCNKPCNKKLSCGRHRCIERCCSSELHLCWNPCGRTLSCKSHQCERECGHIGSCPSCPNVSFDELHCECGAQKLLPPIACGQSRPVCNRLCSREHSCSHAVRHNCHSDATCPPCTELVSKSCPGGHKTLDNVPCFRPVATCGLVCGQPLNGCDHSCIRVCHQDDCVLDNSKCNQPCNRKRADCEHPCAVPCHGSNCQDVMSNCLAQVNVTCVCKLRCIPMICYKLQNAISLIKFSNFSETKRESIDLIISPNDASVFLVCDNECKKNTRNIKLADAFDISMTSSNLQTYYSDSLKLFAKQNIDFLTLVEKTLLDLMKSSKNITEFKNLDENKADFINRYAACFKINSKSARNQMQKINVTIELNRLNVCTPKPLLTDLLRKEFPDLFPLKSDIEKISTLPSTTNLPMSFADRIRLSKKE